MCVFIYTYVYTFVYIYKGFSTLRASQPARGEDASGRAAIAALPTSRCNPTATGREGKHFYGVKDFRTENGSSRCQQLALTGYSVPASGFDWPTRLALTALFVGGLETCAGGGSVRPRRDRCAAHLQG